MIKASAPGKIYLYGEHAVVYGYPAIACAINKRTTVKAEKTDKNDITIESKDLEFKSLEIELNSNKNIQLPEKELEKLSYIKKSIEKIQKIRNQKTGIKLEIMSELPIGGGLGSSATTVISTLFALNKLFELNLSREKIAELGYEVEKEVQGDASPCDTYTATMGGLTKVKNKKETISKEPPILPLVIGSTKSKSPTKELVKQVKELKQRNPEIIKKLFQTIKEITIYGEKAIKKGNIDEIGELMNINQGILDSIGVNNNKLSKMIYYARKNGAKGSKITGAGDGGCMIAIGDKKEKISQAIKLANGKPIKTELTNEGVRLE